MSIIGRSRRLRLEEWQEKGKISCHFCGEEITQFHCKKHDKRARMLVFHHLNEDDRRTNPENYVSYSDVVPCHWGCHIRHHSKNHSEGLKPRVPPLPRAKRPPMSIEARHKRHVWRSESPLSLEEFRKLKEEKEEMKAQGYHKSVDGVWRKKCKGHPHSEEWKRRHSEDIRRASAKKREALLKYQCLETGEKYHTSYDAAEKNNLTKTSVLNSVRENRTLQCGLTFVRLS